MTRAHADRGSRARALFGRARRTTIIRFAGGRAFSLLEVMVAIAILGLAISVILSAQGGLAASNKSAANIGTAVTLGRCRMSELEEKLLKRGYTELDEIDSSSACCAEKDVTGFSCDWRIEKILLPDPPKNDLDGGLMSMFGGGDGGIPGTTSLGSGGLDFDAGLSAIGQSVQSQFGGAGGPGGGGGASGMIGMVFSMIYPSMKPLFEASTRRISVSVKYKEGTKDREFALVQYVTNPQRGGFIQGGDALLGDAGAFTADPSTPSVGAVGGGGVGGGRLAVPGAGGVR